MKSKFFKLHTYLFSILALFFCMNAAQAVDASDQMLRCNVKGIDGTTYSVKFLAYNGIVYSTFGLARTKVNDLDGYLTALDNYGTGSEGNYWHINQDYTSKKWDIRLVHNNKTIINTINADCNPMPFAQSMGQSIEAYYSSNSQDYSLKHEDKKNPIFLGKEIEPIAIEEGGCENKGGEGTEKDSLIPGKRKCCRKGVCTIL
jgi:hypothetical protein